MSESAWAPDPDFWRHRPVAVTGATGFLGSHLTGQLVDVGAEVVALVRDDVPPTPLTARWSDRVSVMRGSVEDQPLVERLLGEYEARTVFHLAAQTQVGVANGNPVSTWTSNVAGTWAVLEAARRSPRIEQVVTASSDKAYGSQSELPYDEAMPLVARNPYDVSKACADMVATSYSDTWGVPVCVTRCGNFFGPGDLNWARVVPGSLRSLLRGERPIVRSDGTPSRDYLYVEDAALAYMRTAEAMAADPALAGEAFNFSTETPMTVLELLGVLRKATGRMDLEPEIRATARNEIPHQALSAEKARRLLDWKPRYSVADAMEGTVAWYRDYLATA